jgi:uroporphyrinogen-III synthase
MMRMLVTRPEPDASDTAARLRALDIEPVIVPLMRFELLQTTLPQPDGFAALAVTSANALRALHDRGELPRFRGLPVYAVGDRTAETARDYGFAEIVSAGGSFGDLVALLSNSGHKGPILYPAARDQAADLAKAIASAGIMVITAPVYRMAAADSLDDQTVLALDSGAIAAALFYSRRTAQIFVTLCDRRLGPGAHRELGALCISETVAGPLIDAHFVRVGLADHPSEEAMMTLALSFARDQARND